MATGIDEEEATASGGFSAAFDELYKPAVRLAARILGEQSAAEDVAAEALARTYARWSRVKDLPYRDAWVLRVAANLAIDAVRRRRPATAPALANEFEDTAALRMALASALSRLPRRQREAVVLRYLGGYSESEVSAALGVSPNTVKTHAQRGLAALRARLDDQGNHIAAL